MHVASGDRFGSFKAGGDRRDGSFFFYHARYRMARREERPQKKVAQKIALLLFFLVVGDIQEKNMHVGKARYFRSDPHVTLHQIGKFNHA